MNIEKKDPALGINKLSNGILDGTHGILIFDGIFAIIFSSIYYIIVSILYLQKLIFFWFLF